jgi:hypothetical protein
MKTYKSKRYGTSEKAWYMQDLLTGYLDGDDDDKYLDDLNLRNYKGEDDENN